MTENKRFELVLNDDGKPIEIKGGYTTITSLKQVVDVLNDLNSTVYYHLDTIKKLESLLEEKVEPTYDDVYLDIDLTTKRCKYENTQSGGVRNSKHLTGYAVDYYIKGVTDSKSGRKKHINIIKKWLNHDYSYGNGYDSNGYNRTSVTMGNAVHTQVK